MSSSQDAPEGSKNIKRDSRGRRGSCSMILLGIALLIGALFLYFYYESNRPKVRTEPGQISNINRTISNAGAEPPRPTPSPAASP
jgi:hypothetical protein